MRFVFLIGGARFFFAAEHIFWKCPIDICINIQDHLRFLTFHLVNILYSMLRSCGFFVEDGGLYENIVNFQPAFLGVLRLYSQANYISFVSSQNLNSSRSTSDFSSCWWWFHSIDSWKIRCRSTWYWEHTCKNKYVFCSSWTQFTCLVSHNFATNNHGQWKTRKRGKQQIRNNFMLFVLVGFIGLQMGFSSW